LRIRVEGEEKRFELSEFRDLRVQPLPEHRVRPTAVITSVSPFPIRLMNDHSPDELKLTIHGQNFIAQHKAIVAFGNSANNQRTLRTKFVSGTTLQAWVPPPILAEAPHWLPPHRRGFQRTPVHAQFGS
jgi:hypothetical protein